VSRLSADPEYERAEFAVIVRSDLKGKGLGWSLMQQLIAYAQHEGLSEIFGSVLHENTTMLRLCRELGFSVDADPDDHLLRRVSLRLRSRRED
jgi:acetyltransferase